MIYTVTLNPSLDYNVTMGSLKTGFVNRTEEEVLLPGGKGINVSLELHNLGVETTALGIVAGFTGEEIVRLVKERGVRADFIRAKQGFSRINMKVHHGEETGINCRGPVVGKEELAALYWRLDMLEEGDVLVLSGSVPDGLSASVYMDIMKYMEGRGVQTVVSAMRSPLEKVLPYHPFLVRPNRQELAESMGEAIKDREAVSSYARKMQEKGAGNVIIEMAGYDIMLVAQGGQEFFGSMQHREIVNMVGAGDALIAGFLAGYFEHGDYREALRLGIAAATASVSETEFAKAGQIRELASQVRID